MYQVVFTGRLLKGADRAMVESELQRLFKANTKQVEWFLRGKPIVVKSCEDSALAKRYYEALTKAGLECELRSDQPASAPMTSPPEEHTAPQEQLPIPSISAPKSKAKPAPKTKPTPTPRLAPKLAPVSIPAPTAAPESAPVAPPPVVQRHAPTLGPVTQAITAQDRAPPLMTAHGADAVIPVRTGVSAPSPVQLNTAIGLLFLLVGAVVVGTLGYFVRQEWLTRGSITTVAQTPVTQPAPPPPTKPVEVQTPKTLIVGRWQCVEAGSGRVVENEFTSDGRYRSLAHGRSDAFQQVDQIDVLVEGRYRLDGDRVVLHVQNIPSREVFGQSAHTDDYLYWRIDSLTRDAMVWADTQLAEVRESCLRSQGLLPRKAS